MSRQSIRNDGLTKLAAWALAVCIGTTLVAIESAEAVAIRPGFNANTLPGNDDGSTGLVGFGFTIDFFGNIRTGGFVNNNGNVTLDSPLGTFTPFNLVTTGREILAPFFGDVDTRNNVGSPVTYGTGTVGTQAAWGANWLNVGYFSVNNVPNQTNRNDFQLVLVDRSDIAPGDFDFEFNIDQVQWETGQASGSDVNGRGGSCARVGWSNGSTASFELPGSGVCGAFLDSGVPAVIPGPLALINNELNSALAIDSGGSPTLGRYLFQVRSGQVIDPTIPEPGPLALLAIGSLGIAVITRRRRNKR